MAALVSAGCGLSPEWYKDYGILSASELSEPASIPKLLRVYEQGDCQKIEAATLAIQRSGVRSGEISPSLVRGLDACYPYAWYNGEQLRASLALLSLLREVDVAAAARYLVQNVNSADWNGRKFTANQLQSLAYAGPEVLASLDFVAKNDSDPDVRMAAGTALGYLQAIKDTPGGQAATLARPSTAARTFSPRATVIVALFDVQDPSKHFKDDTLDQLTEYLATRLTELAGYRVVPRDQLRERLVAQKTTGYRECFDQSCQIDLGKAISAQKSLAVKVLRVGGKCAITASLYDLKSETTERGASVRTECSDDALMDAMDQIARQLAGQPTGPA